MNEKGKQLQSISGSIYNLSLDLNSLADEEENNKYYEPIYDIAVELIKIGRKINKIAIDYEKDKN